MIDRADDLNKVQYINDETIQNCEPTDEMTTETKAEKMRKETKGKIMAESNILKL